MSFCVNFGNKARDSVTFCQDTATHTCASASYHAHWCDMLFFRKSCKADMVASMHASSGRNTCWCCFRTVPGSASGSCSTASTRWHAVSLFCGLCRLWARVQHLTLIAIEVSHTATRSTGHFPHNQLHTRCQGAARDPSEPEFRHRCQPPVPIHSCTVEQGSCWDTPVHSVSQRYLSKMMPHPRGTQPSPARSGTLEGGGGDVRKPQYDGMVCIATTRPTQHMKCGCGEVATAVHTRARKWSGSIPSGFVVFPTDRYFGEAPMSYVNILHGGVQDDKKAPKRMRGCFLRHAHRLGVFSTTRSSPSTHPIRSDFTLSPR